MRLVTGVSELREAPQIRFAVHDGVVLVFLGALAAGLLLAAPGSSTATWALAIWLVVAGGIAASRIVVGPGRLGSLLYRTSVLTGLISSYLSLGSAFAVLHLPVVDAELTRLDAMLFGVFWADAGPVPPTFLVEYFAFFYLSYFAVLLGYAIPRAVFGRAAAAAEIAAAMILVYCLGQTLYVLVPAVGPGPYFGTTADLARGPLSKAMLAAVDSFGAKKDVFPSLHVAATLVAAMHAYRHRSQSRGGRVVATLLTFVAANVAVATLALRWHYAVDLAAGAALGLAADRASIRLVRWEARRRGPAMQAAWLGAESASDEQDDDRVGVDVAFSARSTSARQLLCAGAEALMDANNEKRKELNLGKIDRTLRIVIGVVLVSQVAFSAPAWVGLLGLVLVLTGTMGFCPIYGAFGLRTCRAGT